MLVRHSPVRVHDDMRAAKRSLSNSVDRLDRHQTFRMIDNSDSNIEKTKDGLVEKSSGRKIESPLDVKIQINKKTIGILDQITRNQEKMNSLLDENKDLLTKVLQGSFKTIQTGL